MTRGRHQVKMRVRGAQKIPVRGNQKCRGAKRIISVALGH